MADKPAGTPTANKDAAPDTEPENRAPDTQGDSQSENTSVQKNPAPPQAENGAKPGQDAPDDDKGKKKRHAPRWLQPVLLLAGIVAALLVIAWGIRFWRYSSSHTGTDDAYTTSDIVQITPQVAGSIVKVLVSDNQHVNAGDLLAVMDDASYRASVDQAKANLEAARTGAQGAGSQVELTNATGSAQIEQAVGGIQQAEGAIRGAEADLQRFQAATANAQASVQTAQANVKTAQAALDAALAARDRSAETVKSAQAAVETAQAAVRTAQAQERTAQANADKADKDQARYAVLFSEDAVSAQQVDAVTAATSAARSNLDAARQQIEQVQATAAQRIADVKASKESVRSADAAAAQSRSQVQAARDAVIAQQALVRQAQAQYRSGLETVAQQKGRRVQAAGTLQQARTAPQQLSVSRASQQTAQAKIAQAQAALETAQIALNDTRLRAPYSGRISRKTVQIGQQVSIGQALMAIIPDNDLWVTANFKETQLRDVRVGQKAEIEVDELGGQIFTGRVDSIAAGTGATFALLPPDNATGNFTKVVQRVPVKILLDPNQKNRERLRAGLSVIATITTKE